MMFGAGEWAYQKATEIFAKFLHKKLVEKNRESYSMNFAKILVVV
jgi:hypothetical protein